MYYDIAPLLPILGLVSVFLSGGSAQCFDCNQCQLCEEVETIDISIAALYCSQPFFVNILPNTEENRLLDNQCWTYYPLPDDPHTYKLVVSRVFTDGSSDVITYNEIDVSPGVCRKATPFATNTDFVLGYVGCNTYVKYSCRNFGSFEEPFVFGGGPDCRPLGLACLRKVEELIKANGLPKQDLYLLPMQMPNRCVTQQLCIAPKNPFYNQLSGYSSSYDVA